MADMPAPGDLAPAFGVWDIADIGAFIDCFIAGCD